MHSILLFYVRPGQFEISIKDGADNFSVNLSIIIVEYAQVHLSLIDFSE